MNNRVHIYLRVSSAYQEQYGCSLDVQKVACITYAKHQGMEIVEIHTETSSADSNKVRTKMSKKITGRKTVGFAKPNRQLSCWRKHLGL